MRDDASDDLPHADAAPAADAPEDALDLLFQSPYPYFGGKARIARTVWKRFGDVPSYVEPFFGSGAVLLNRSPADDHGIETVNDRDGLVSNFWRACKADPDTVAGYADWPVNENDLAAGRGERGLLAWMRALAERLRRVRVCCGDWTRVCGGTSGDALSHLIHQTPCGVFLDPPYSLEAERDMGCYRVDSGSVAHAVRAWALRHGDDERFRIALCGYEGEHPMPASWSCVAWKARGGMGNQGNGRGRENAARERVWFSPPCLTPARRPPRPRQLLLFPDDADASALGPPPAPSSAVPAE
jgi:hypothetical protein